MSQVSITFLESVLAKQTTLREDTYLHSPLYYLLTGRKGARLYKKDNTIVVVAQHPHVDDCVLVFPEIGKQDYELTASILDMIDVPKNGVQLARYSEKDIGALRKQLARLNYTTVTGIKAIEEAHLDWHYPVHIVDTKKISEMSGPEFVKIRHKFKQASHHITHIALTPDNIDQCIRAALKFWEGNMIYNGKETPDMSEFYLAFLNILSENPDASYSGKLFIDDRRPVGFAVWDTPTGDTANSLINISDTTIRGLSEFQMVSMCRDLHAQGVQYFNLGGSEKPGLDSYKSKFMPVKSLRIQSAIVSYQHHINDNIESFDLVTGL